ncbi:MAG TPA: molybdate ABC transporter substrate-binding protein [Thermoanaerobaculia bacterium]|nr:molybdate ABC transporter substrate-binding protein [Thermoanaerobaculia bacterium]
MRGPGGAWARKGGVVSAALFWAATAGSAEVSVAAAADLKFALDAAVSDFRKSRADVGVTVTYGSSGSFFAQIESGAPFDLFLSADVDYPEKLAARGLTVPGSEFLYAIGRIVVWVRKESPLDLAGRGLLALAAPSVTKVAIANPRHAPYGRAAEAALKSLGVWDAVREKLVFGENVAQAAQFVESGAAEAGILALSLALAPEMAAKGRWAEIPASAHPPLRQGGVILKSSTSPDAAKAFRDYLVGPAGRAALARYGFALSLSSP